MSAASPDTTSSAAPPATPVAPPSSGDGRVAWLPDTHFFIRRVPVARTPGAPPAADQVGVAVEALAPFGLNQVYHGWYCPAGAGSALVFAAHRRRFDAQMTAGWPQLDVVLPCFAGLLGWTPAASETVLVQTPGALTALVFSAGDPVPQDVVVMPCGDEESGMTDEQALKALQKRLGAPPAGRSWRRLAAPKAVAHPDRHEGLRFVFDPVGQGAAVTVDPADADLVACDVRDKAVIRERRRAVSLSRGLWRGFAVVLGLIALALVMEIGMGVFHFMLEGRRKVVRSRDAEVQQLVTANGLATRIEELGSNRLRPYHMLSLINEGRPPSIYYTRMTTRDLRGIEVEAQTTNAADVGTYEQWLRSAPFAASVDVSNLQSREGRTSFTVVVTFKPEALAEAPPGQPGAGGREGGRP